MLTLCPCGQQLCRVLHRPDEAGEGGEAEGGAGAGQAGRGGGEAGGGGGFGRPAAEGAGAIQVAAAVAAGWDRAAAGSQQ